ncbi:DsbA family oxidoreductase [Croceibacterium xixiisoli]|nr:DsbA family oxidoreductase [Croceibacterium xixiisoli]
MTANDTIPCMTVDIWSDVMCPWCAIGYTQFAQAVVALEGELAVDIRWMPFELNPDMPTEGRRQDDHLAAALGRPADQIAQMRQQVIDAAQAVGFPMRETGDDGAPSMVWNTFAAHRLLRWALNTSGPEAQTRLKLALLHAHFADHRAVGQEAVLIDIAAEAGFDRAAATAALADEALAAETRAEEQRGIQSGINSVPSFVIGGRFLLPGSREPEAFVKALRKIAWMDEEQAERF